MTILHPSQLGSNNVSTNNLKPGKQTDSLVSVRLSRNEDFPQSLDTPIPDSSEITMHFPDDTEIARSSRSTTDGSSLISAEEKANIQTEEQPADMKQRNTMEGFQSEPQPTSSVNDTNPSDTELQNSLQTSTKETQLEDQLSSLPAAIEIPLKDEAPEPLTNRNSKVRFDMDQNATESLRIPSSSTIHEQDENVEQKSSSETVVPLSSVNDHSFEAELQRNMELGRPESEGSAESEGDLVDWQELDRTEVEEKRDGATDESMRFLLARLEKENNALATDPKANITYGRARSTSRPPSLHMIKKLVNEPPKPQLRYSLLPTPPPMTELEFWGALVQDYPSTAQRLPTLTSNKIRGGIPPPLRGVVWQSIAGARDPLLEDEYIRLSVESSPYEKMIHKDVGRSFPGVDMFRDPNGSGQRMLSKVLNAFSLFDQEIGYCQGLGFVVGPLLMHMGDKEAFCVLVRLMEHYDLRSCFLPSLRGLHLRIYQFQHLLAQHLPELTAHLERLKVEPLYLSQWFLSFFGVTCPLPMLIRIYDVILTEGASETLMRVALSLMRRNAPKILATLEFEDVMHLLLSRSLWNTYGCNADDLVNDFVGWTGLVTREGLESLEASFTELEQSNEDKPGIHTAASRFLGRFWTGNNVAGKPIAAPTLSMPVKNSTMQRIPSKQSVASTLNSVESAEEHRSIGSNTTSTSISQDIIGDDSRLQQALAQPIVPNSRVGTHQDKDLHGQIEDLLLALSDLQRENSSISDDLQQEREQREEDKAAVIRALSSLRNQGPSTIAGSDGDVAGSTELDADPLEMLDRNINTAISELETQFTNSNKRSSLALQTKQQLREDATRWKNLYHEETLRTATLTAQLNEKDQDAAKVKEELRQARTRIADSHREQQRLEKTNQDLKSRKSVAMDSFSTSPAESPRGTSPASGLRELRLGRNSTSSSLNASQPTFSRRSSSLIVRDVAPTEDHKSPSDDALLHELVNAKTSEALARQELEEVKAKLDSLRKMLNVSTPSGSGHQHSASIASVRSIAIPGTPRQDVKKDSTAAATPSSYTAAGFFSGWGKKGTS